MAYKIEFIPEALKDFDKLDKSLKIQAKKKIDKLSENPYIGEPLSNKAGRDLTGFYKLYFYKKKHRIVYRIIEDKIEVVQIWGIGKRDKSEIYNTVFKRLD